ncbi:glycosyltransferase [Candidatus Woesearchaeota archaeon]|nr:glycosyltransferase [Candidatus Woesearchaeota archaeon]
MSEPSVSIIIPFKKLDSLVLECIKKCQLLDYSNYEILLLPDRRLKGKFRKCRVYPTGPVFPSIKRNTGVSKSRSEICAFIDADAYPDKKWLKNAVRLFSHGDIGAVAGPNHVPPDVSIAERAAGDVLFSGLGVSTVYFIRKYKYPGTYEYKESPTSNLLIKTAIVRKLHGFDTLLLTSEDSKLCWQIRNKLKKKIIFSKDVFVYHHRRPLYWPHVRRMFVEGRNKAWLFKEIPNFKALLHLAPSAFVLFLVGGAVLSPFSETLFTVYLGIIALYLLLVMLQSIKTRHLIRGLLVLIGIPSTHISYGLGFIRGLLTKKKRKK